MRIREDYKVALALVRSVVHEWDPCALLHEGAPDDEFDAEIAKVVAYIPHIASAADASRAISTVFSAAFEPELFTAAQCAKPGQALFARLVAAGFLSGA